MTNKRVMKLALIVAALLPAWAGSALAEPAHVGYPNSIAATGDSGNTGYNSAAPNIDDRRNAWSTGSDPSVQSHYLRIRAANPKIGLNAVNVAKDGSPVTDLARQAALLKSQKPDYVTVDFGTPSFCDPAPNTAFRQQWVNGLTALSRAAPNARIFVTSIWWGNAWFDTIRAIPDARGSVDAGRCDPLWDTPQEQQRRADLDRALAADNATIAAACARLIHCRFDGGAASAVVPTAADLSRDFGHPSPQGAAKIAAATWGATFDFTDATAPVSKATRAGRRVTLSATDDRGLAGIEYKLGTGAWVRYSKPVTPKKGQKITWRAVDVSGNSEATHSLTLK